MTQAQEREGLFERESHAARPKITSRINVVDCPPDDPWWTDGKILCRGPRKDVAHTWDEAKLADLLRRAEDGGPFSPAKLLYYCVSVEDAGEGVSDRPVPCFTEFNPYGYGGSDPNHYSWNKPLKGYWGEVHGYYSHTPPVAVFFAAGRFYCYGQHYVLALLKAAGKKGAVSWRINMKGTLKAVNGRTVGYLQGIKDYISLVEPPLASMAKEAGLITTEQGEPSNAEKWFLGAKEPAPPPRTRAEKTLYKMGLWPIAA